jgi:hypothetical protein
VSPPLVAFAVPANLLAQSLVQRFASGFVFCLSLRGVLGSASHRCLADPSGTGEVDPRLQDQADEEHQESGSPHLRLALAALHPSEEAL